MESNWAAAHLQVIRTLMERSALYRRALMPIMMFAGALGVAGGVVGHVVGITSPRVFVGYWAGVGLVALAGSFLLVRRQALKAAEPFWSPPARRVAQAVLPPFFAGAAAGVLALAWPECAYVPPHALPAIWMILYGCGLTAAGFFMPRGIKLLGWLFVLSGAGLMAARCLAGAPDLPVGGHAIMGGAFGGLHLAYGIYLCFTEPRGNEA